MVKSATLLLVAIILLIVGVVVAISLASFNFVTNKANSTDANNAKIGNSTVVNNPVFYLQNPGGSDLNDGKTTATAVQTLQRGLELVSSSYRQTGWSGVAELRLVGDVFAIDGEQIVSIDRHGLGGRVTITSASANMTSVSTNTVWEASQNSITGMDIAFETAPEGQADASFILLPDGSAPDAPYSNLDAFMQPFTAQDVQTLIRIPGQDFNVAKGDSVTFYSPATMITLSGNVAIFNNIVGDRICFQNVAIQSIVADCFLDLSGLAGSYEFTSTTKVNLVNGVNNLNLRCAGEMSMYRSMISGDSKSLRQFKLGRGIARLMIITGCALVSDREASEGEFGMSNCIVGGSSAPGRFDLGTGAIWNITDTQISSNCVTLTSLKVNSGAIVTMNNCEISNSVAAKTKNIIWVLVGAHLTISNTMIYKANERGLVTATGFGCVVMLVNVDTSNHPTLLAEINQGAQLMIQAPSGGPLATINDMKISVNGVLGDNITFSSHHVTFYPAIQADDPARVMFVII